MADPGVEHRHQVQRLHHVRAVLARQREIGFEIEVAVQALHRLDHLLCSAGGVAADLQQCEHQAGEFMPHRNAREPHADIGAGAADHETGPALVVGTDERDLAAQARDLGQQRLKLARLGVVAQARDQFDRFADIDQIGFELLRQMSVEHGGSLSGRGCRAGSGRGGQAPHPTAKRPGAREEGSLRAV